MREMRETRIPLWVESQRGDDRFGTNLNTGAIISDHEAQTQGVPFQQGIPQNQIQKAVEMQLQQDKWVCIEKNDGSTELLTKKDLPKLYPAPVIVEPPKIEPKAEPQKVLFVSLPKIEFKGELPKQEVKADIPKVEQPKAEPPKEQPKPNDDWKTAFNVNPVKPEPVKTEPVKTEPVKPPVVKPASVNPTTDKPSAEKPKQDKTVWESKFEDIKSATATHKGKGG